MFAPFTLHLARITIRTMYCFWQMPVHRDPISLELLIDSFVSQTCEASEQLGKSIVASNETLAYWWDHPHHRSVFILLIILGVITTWLVKSSIMTRQALRAHVVSQKLTKTNTVQKTTADAGAPLETPQRPCAIQVMDKTGKDSSLSARGTQAPFGIGATVNGHDSCFSTPGDQTPSVNNAGRRNFSGLAKTAPANYFTLQQNGVLDAMGTPTSKFRSSPMMELRVASDDEEYVHVFDSPTRSFGRVRKSQVAPKKAQREPESV